MLKLSEEHIIQRIQSGELFECESLNGSFTIKVASYAPVICAAIHAGQRMRSAVLSQCALSTEERFYEEDPFTEQFIQAMPITLTAQDSRYEYDLNRPIANCIYHQAWGKTVWKKKLSNKERRESVAKHQSFYRVLDALTAAVEHRFGAALIIDTHSYNYLRREGETPTFNIGTEQVDTDRWQSVIDLALNELAEVELPNMPVTAEKNTVFFGRGYLISHINSRFQHTLVLPLEIKKIFMDEISGEPYPLVMQALCQQLKHCLVTISTFFTRRFTSKKRVRKADMLTEQLDPIVIDVDRRLYQLAKGLETLHYINPINIATERKHFLKSHGAYQPRFRYRQLDIDPYPFREQLYRLPIDLIRDPSIQSLYRDVVDSLSEKIALLVKAGSPDFLYESLKYYGEPNQADEDNARFLLHAASIEAAIEAPVVTTEQLVSQMKSAAAQWDMPCKIEVSTKLAASAMVSNHRKTVFIAKNLQLTEIEANALIHHELGVHMATTLNAAQQPLKVFSLGLPGNTLTQEGLAILNEYQSGHITLKRLQGLAHRVLAVREMLNYGDFRHTYRFLLEEQKLSPEIAFKLSVRVHRGGGFTKDYLYLTGVSTALALYKEKDISNLYIGKTGFDYLPVIDEMVERRLVASPVYVPQYFQQPRESPPVLGYLMDCIHPANRQTIHYGGSTPIAA